MDEQNACPLLDMLSKDHWGYFRSFVRQQDMGKMQRAGKRIHHFLWDHIIDSYSFPHYIPETSIAPYFEKTQNITRLDLGGCENITDEVAKTIFSSPTLSKVKHLNVGSTKLTGTTLGFLSGLQKLQNLDISCCSMENDAIAHLSALTNLTSLNFFVEIENAGLAYCAGLTNLTYLDVSYCSKITSDALEMLIHFPRLTYLDITRCDIARSQFFEDLTQLRALQLQSLSLPLSFVPQLTNLIYLTFGERSINTIDFELESMTQLTRLAISGGNYPAGLLVQHLSPLTNLTQVEVILRHSTQEDFEFLTALQQLSRFSFPSCVPTPDGLFPYLEGLTKLKKLYLTAKVTDDGLKRLPALTSLTQLDFGYSMNVGNKGYQYLTALTNLTRLRLNPCAPEQDEGSGKTNLAFITNLTRLLDLKAHYLEGEVFHHITNLTSLELLNLQSTQLDDDAFVHFRALKNLTNLDVHAGKVTIKGLKHLYGLESLKQLKMRKTNVEKEDAAEFSNLSKIAFCSISPGIPKKAEGGEEKKSPRRTESLGKLI